MEAAKRAPGLPGQTRGGQRSRCRAASRTLSPQDPIPSPRLPRASLLSPFPLMSPSAPGGTAGCLFGARGRGRAGGGFREPLGLWLGWRVLGWVDFPRSLFVWLQGVLVLARGWICGPTGPTGRWVLARVADSAVVGRCAAISVHEHAIAPSMMHVMWWLRWRSSGLCPSALKRDGLHVSVGGVL